MHGLILPLLHHENILQNLPNNDLHDGKIVPKIIPIVFRVHVITAKRSKLFSLNLISRINFSFLILLENSCAIKQNEKSEICALFEVDQAVQKAKRGTGNKF